MFGPPRENPTTVGIVHFKHTHTRYRKTRLLAYLVEIGVWSAASKANKIGTVHFKHTHTRYPETLLLAYLVQRFGCLGRRIKPQNFWHCAIQTHPYQVPRDTVAGIFGAEVWVSGVPRPNPTIFGIVHFKHTHTRYPDTLLLAYLLQKYGCLGRGIKTAHFLALWISNTQILGTQKQCCWHIWCTGIGVQSATSNPQKIRHVLFQTPPY